MTNSQFPQHPRLKPRTPFKGGRITETDVLDLTEAAKFASVHAGAEITPADFLRAAGRGEITLLAIVHQTVKLERVGGGVYCNAGQTNENTAPAGAILNLPLSACSQLAATGRASWRTFDGFETVDGILMRYTVAELLPDEPDFETVTDDCRVKGDAVNALADAYVDEPAPASEPVTAKPVQRSAAQDAAILQRLKSLGYDPLALPKNKPGKAGAKSAVRNALKQDPLFIGSKVFDKAWERLSANSEIVILN